MWEASTMRRIALLAAFLLMASLLQAQHVATIRGRVFERGKGMSGVVVSVHDASGKLAAYCISDTVGVYAVRYNIASDSITLRLNAFNVKAQQHRLENKSQIRDFNVELASFELQEVIVNPPKIYSVGDTVNYSVQEWVAENDQNLEELLRRLPGITVADNGLIMYNGRPINKFYIEGLDLMGGNYAMITSRLQPSAVETIQVMENHQHVKALRGVQHEEKASINLKLRPEFKNVWMFDALAGGGVELADSLLFQADFTAIVLGKQRQVFSGVGGNNVGQVSRAQTVKQTEIYVPRGLLESARLADPPIKASLYRRNADAEAHSSLVQRTEKGWNLRMNAIYQHTNDHAHAQQRATFPSLANDTAAYMRRSSSHEWADYASLNLQAERNDDSLYVMQHLYGLMNRQSGNSSLHFNDMGVAERLASNTYAINSNTYVVDRRGRGCEASIRANIGRSDQMLRLNGMSDSFFFWHDTTGLSVQQLAVRNSAALSMFGRLLEAFRWKRWFFDPTLAVQLAIEGLDSDAEGSCVPQNDTLQNSLLYADAKLMAGLAMRYERRRMVFRFDLLASGQMCMAHIKLPYELRQNRFVPALLPSASIDYKPRRNVHFLLKYNVSYLLPQIDELYGGYLLSNYQRMSRFNASLPLTLMQSGQLTATHRKSLSMLFQRLYASYSYGISESLTSLEFNGMLTEVRQVPLRGNTQSYGAGYSVSKGFDLLAGFKLSLELDYKHENRDELVEQQRVVQQYDRYSLAEGIYLKPCNWLSIEHSGVYSSGHSAIKERADRYQSKALRGSLAFQLDLLNGLLAKFEMLGYYGSSQASSYKILLSNIEASYKWMNWKFALRCNNIGNVKQFESLYISFLQRSHTLQQIRGTSVLFTASLSFR